LRCNTTPRPRVGAGYNAMPLVGAAEQIVDGMVAMS
jgi:hypothetical protein